MFDSDKVITSRMVTTLLSLVLTTTFLTVTSTTTSIPYPDWKNVDNLRHPYSNDDILVIKTNSTLGSGDQVAIQFEPTKAGASNRQIFLYFTSTTSVQSIFSVCNQSFQCAINLLACVLITVCRLSVNPVIALRLLCSPV